MAQLFVNSNGTILSNDTPTIQAGNRAHLYGDGVFESIRIMNGRPLNMENHVKRLLEGAIALKMRPSVFFTVTFFEEKVLQLIEKSGIKEGGRCRISLDRISGGAYTPTSNEAIYFIEVYPIENNSFDLNSKGWEIDLYSDLKKVKNSLSNYKTKNGLLFVMAAINAAEKQLDEVLIVNEKGAILESSSSNIFVVSNGVLYTPGLDEGCLAGTMRMQIINLAVSHGIKVYECTIFPQNIIAADEIFLTNSIKGISWVSGYRTKRYFNNTSRKLVAYLNEYWENSMNS
jgi:branched-subunit amino acid aminotransferase/4-amino-4-deoxychorismate lyase